MKELTCPKCGNVFTVDEADYAAILNQVKNREFDAEVDRRLAELHRQQMAEQEAATLKAKSSFDAKLSAKDVELSKKDGEIARLNEQLSSIAQSKQLEFNEVLAKKQQEIAELKSTIGQSDSQKQLAVMEERNKAQTLLNEKSSKIQQLESEAKMAAESQLLREKELKERFTEQLNQMKEQVDYYKDLKTKMSTKMVGETLEQHCSIQFEQYIRPYMPNASFGKDNDASEGTKGDFILRDSEDGVEYISIMFEMKNEMDTTSTKHKNEDFLKKLDEDRKKKNCEFAVLVSLLESDNELYNQGIVNKSYMYDKMYVIRPQFFVPFINLIVQTSKKSLEYKKALILAQSKEVDVTNFENRIEAFKSSFARHYELSSKKFNEAIKEIDASIKKLEAVKTALLSSENNLRLANQDTDDLTIRKLTYKNPTMKTMFEEARKAQDGQEVE